MAERTKKAQEFGFDTCVSISINFYTRGQIEQMYPDGHI